MNPDEKIRHDFSNLGMTENHLKSTGSDGPVVNAAIKIMRGESYKEILLSSGFSENEMRKLISLHMIAVYNQFLARREAYEAKKKQEEIDATPKPDDLLTCGDWLLGFCESRKAKSASGDVADIMRAGFEHWLKNSRSANNLTQLSCAKFFRIIAEGLKKR